MRQEHCRHCGSNSLLPVVDLGMSPLCESYLPRERLGMMEPFYPLKVQVCSACLLVQVPALVAARDIFTEYAYFSSFSSSWLRHAERYVEMVTDRLALGERSFVVEVGSNDGYLLQYFVKRGIRCLGIEPAANVAEAARAKGVETHVAFFCRESAGALLATHGAADLIIGNNVLAQVPDLHSFVAGVSIALAPSGTATFEFPHLMELFEHNQFDTIYHEHFWYFSLLAAERVFAEHGLALFDVERLPTHGGSLRVYVRPAADPSRPVTERVGALRAREEAAGFREAATYSRFEERVRATKRRLLGLLIEVKRQGKSIVGYGAPGKGNTLLNYCGIREDFLEFTVDKNPYKQGKFLPGTHVPIHAPESLEMARPDFILILPWNLKTEIMDQLAHARQWGARFILPIPEATIV